MDKIRIENLEIFAKHGVFPEENFLGQKFVLSAVLHTDTRKAGLTDELSYSVHYGEVSHLIKKVVEENTWKLLETVAEATAKAILLSYLISDFNCFCMFPIHRCTFLFLFSSAQIILFMHLI